MPSHRKRYRQIAETLSRHGMGYLVGTLGLDRLVPFHHGLLGHDRRELPYSRPEHLRLALEELGPTFVKLGQLLSTRMDLVGPEYGHELSKLQDAVPAIPIEAVRGLIEAELGRPAEEAFASFHPEPLAAASIGQAHAATMHDGSEVVVKVRRPGVVEAVNEDLEILRNLARRAAGRWEAAAGYDIVGLADEFAATLRSEVDYLHEGENAERFAANFEGDDDVHVPRVFWETTTARVLTLERVRGLRVDDLDALDAAGIDRRQLAMRATRITAKMVFEHGFFHADPHPGNLFIEPGGRIGVIDFGMVGVVDDALREKLAVLLLAVSDGDADRIARAVIALALTPTRVDRARLKEDLGGLVSRYEGRTLGELRFTALLEEVLALVRAHRLRLPRELALLVKMALMNEGMGVRLDPEFRLASVLAPYARRLAVNRLSPWALARRLRHAGVEMADLGMMLPEQLRGLVTELGDGGLRVGLNADDLEPLAFRAERIGNRLVAGMIAAAFVDGLAELIALDPERRGSWESPVLAFGLGAAGSLGAYLFWTARRERRRRSSGAR